MANERCGIFPAKQYDAGIFSLFVQDPEDCYCEDEIFDRGQDDVWVYLDKDRNIFSECHVGNRVIVPLSAGELTEDIVIDAFRASMKYISEIQDVPLDYHATIVLDGYVLYFPRPEFFGVVAYNLANKAGFAFMPEAIKKRRIENV